MSQNTIVMAFRKRLSSWGYSQISIKQKLDDYRRVVRGVYVVKAVEPLAGLHVEADYTLESMRHSFR